MRKIEAKHILLDDGWRQDVVLTIDSQGHIASITPRPQEGAQEDVALVLPAMGNLHSHSFQRALAGLGERRGTGASAFDDFWSWRKLMYQLANTVTPDHVGIIATKLFIDMVKAGYGHVGEFHYLHIHGEDGLPGELMAQAIIEAAEVAGIRLTLIPVLYERAGFEDEGPSHQQARFTHQGDDYLKLIQHLIASTALHPRCQVGLGFHSLRAVTPQSMRDVLNGAVSLGFEGPIHIHIAEQMREIEECLSVHRQRPVEWLFDQADVDEHWCLVHATHLTDSESDLIAHSGAVAGLCPTTEANLGDGIFELSRFENAGGRYGIGSDSHITVDPFDELRWLEYSNRLWERKRLVAGRASGEACGTALYQSAVRGGAQALGQAHQGLCEGGPADLLLFGDDHPLLQGRSGPDQLDGLIFGQAKGSLREVVIAGQSLVRDNRHAAADEANEAYQRLLLDLNLAANADR